MTPFAGQGRAHQARVRPAAIVMSDPLAKDLSQMPLMERNEMVETFATRCSDQSLAKCVRLRDAGRGFQHPQVHRFQRVVDGGCEHGIAIVHHEPVRFVAGQHVSKLQRRPLGRRMLRDIPMQNPTGADLQQQEHTRRNVAVTATKKSQANVSRAWFRTNVLQVCGDEHGRGTRAGACTASRSAARRRRPA